MASDPVAKKYEKYADRMQFEHSLINNRITWMLVSQSVLFAAYSSTFEQYEKAAQLRDVVAVVGFSLSALALVAIAASIFAKYWTWKDLRDEPVYRTEPFWVRTPITSVAAAAELAVPLVFMWAWLVL